MSVLKVIEIMGDSSKGWEEAAREAVEEAAKSVKNIRSVWIKDHAATVEDVNAEKGTLDVSVNFFGRPTPLSLGYWEVEPI